MIKKQLRHYIRLKQIHDLEKREDVQWFLSNVPITDTVIDICGGWGLWMFMMKQKGYTFNYVDIDINPEYILEGKQINERLHLKDNIFISMDASTGLPFDDESFNQAWMFGWFIAKDKEPIIKEAYRVLKSDGCLMCNMIQSDLPLFNDFVVMKSKEYTGRNLELMICKMMKN